MPSNWSQDIYIKAYKFAAKAHWDKTQLVPGTDIPYLMHFSFVAMEIVAALAVESGLNGNLAVQCALLHDTMEDTDVTYDDLMNEFGKEVTVGVVALTKDKKVATNLSDEWQRKDLQMTDSLKRIKSQPKEIWMVKMADRITNLQPPPSHWTEEKVNRYKEESILIYDSLKDAGEFLAKRLQDKINTYSYGAEK